MKKNRKKKTFGTNLFVEDIEKKNGFSTKQDALKLIKQNRLNFIQCFKKCLTIKINNTQKIMCVCVFTVIRMLFQFTGWE